ncbi:hypothetical protein FA15DRAFT_549743, partial [Coprinopsis marcescibilis]
HLDEMGQHIKISHQTVIKRLKGRRSQLEYASDREIMMPEEHEVVIKYLIQCANQGFLLTHTWLKEVIDNIL